MKNAIFFVMLLMTGTVLGQASDNQIYINQVGQQATIVMEQTGENNTIGSDDGQTPFYFNGDQQDITITQTGNNNSLYGWLYGNGILATIMGYGDNNEITLNNNPNGSFSADDTQYDINITGGNNTLLMNVGTADVADGSIFTWDITGDYNNFNATVNSENAESTITMVGNYNNVTTSATGFAGHNVNIDHTGDYTNFNITQAGATETNSITIESTTSGTAQTPSTICVYQSNTGTSGC